MRFTLACETIGRISERFNYKFSDNVSRPRLHIDQSHNDIIEEANKRIGITKMKWLLRTILRKL
jgi:hypothetical protein